MLQGHRGGQILAIVIVRCATRVLFIKSNYFIFKDLNYFGIHLYKNVSNDIKFIHKNFAMLALIVIILFSHVAREHIMFMSATSII